MDFLLAKQELIELIKARNVVEALVFATKHLAPFGEKNVRSWQELFVIQLVIDRQALTLYL